MPCWATKLASIFVLFNGIGIGIAVEILGRAGSCIISAQINSTSGTVVQNSTESDELEQLVVKGGTSKLAKFKGEAAIVAKSPATQ